ncbi:MAG: hypothetical protein JWP89_1411 [Schlesneria sp.]|nr:hypothetical protein [Schlesneria sp.]
MTGSDIPVLWPTDIDSTSSNLCDQLNEAISDKILRIVQLSYKVATIGQKLLILLPLFRDSAWDFIARIGHLLVGDLTVRCGLCHEVVH